MSKETFSVYSTAIPSLNPDNPEQEPRALEKKSLSAEKAVKVAMDCIQRALMGRVIIVSDSDDTIACEWHHKNGLVFPKTDG